MKCWVVCRQLGVASEVWMHRQIVGFTRVRPEVVCWGRENIERFPLGDLSVRVLPPPPPAGGVVRRWLRRLANVGGGNYFGAAGAGRGALADALRQSQPAVILTHFGHMALWVLPAALKRGVPVVAHFHGHDVTASLRNRWYRSSLERSLGRFAALVVVAEYQREALVRLGAAPEKIHLIPCGAPAPAEGPASDVTEQPCRFLTVGRFVPKKGPLETIRAFAACLRRAPGSSLTMIGDGPLWQEARTLAGELGVAAQTRLLGSQSAAAVADEMRRAGVFVQHSVTSADGDMEGWPVAVAEAMFAGLPVVATRHAGITEQVIHGETGFLVDEHDWPALGERMSELANDPARRGAMGARSTQTARGSFDQKAMIARLEAVLLSAALPPGGGDAGG